MGEVRYQPATHGAPLQLTAVVGALGSALAVKLAPVLERPAAFCAVTAPLCVPEPLEKVYAPAVFDQPLSVGNA